MLERVVAISASGRYITQQFVCFEMCTDFQGFQQLPLCGIHVATVKRVPSLTVFGVSIRHHLDNERYGGIRAQAHRLV